MDIILLNSEVEREQYDEIRNHVLSMISTE